MTNTTAATPETQSQLPMVSIIFLTYNHEKFVVESLRSVLTQTYPRLDIVITDDASQDATATLIAAELAKHADRADVRFVCSEQNLGGLGRGNFLKGLSLSRGDFIVVSCGDDVMLPTMIDEMVKVWRGDNVSLVTANAVYIDENSRELDRFFRNPGGPYDESFETLARDGSNATCFGAAMGFERSLYNEFGWPPEYLTASDIMMPFYAYLSKGARFIPTPLLKYRVHAQNTSLSLQAESSDTIDKLFVEEQIFLAHLAHSFLMEAELDRLNESDPTRFSNIARTIKPLIAVQTIEMARKLVKTRIALRELGVTKLAAAVDRK